MEKEKKAIPMILLVFVLNASMYGAFNIMAPTIATQLNISSVTVSMISMVAGLGLGIAGVVYAALSDYISIKKLMLVGILMMNVGAILSFVLSGMNFYLFLIGIGLMFLGGSSAASLIIIYVSRYFPAEEHPKYFGFTTASIGGGQILGVIIGGVFATYVGWQFVFAVPLLSLIAIRPLQRYIPDDVAQGEKKLDVIGLGLIGLFSFLISMYFNLSDWKLLVASLATLFAFLAYISKGENRIITLDFFKNRSFLIVLILAIIVFGVQMSFSFLMSFAVQAIYQVTPDKVAAMLLPSYIVVTLIGANVGRIVEKLGNKQTLYVALSGIALSLLAGAALIDKSFYVVAVLSCVFSGFFALPYTLFMQAVVSTVKPEQIGTGIGFFTLVQSIGQSIVIVITGKMLLSAWMSTSSHLVKASASVYSNILLVFAIAVAIALVIFYRQIRKGNISLN